MNQYGVNEPYEAMRADLVPGRRPVVSPSSAYFAWRHYHPRESEDPQAVWGAAWRAGGRAAMHDSSRIVELVPLLRDLLCLLEDGAVENLVRATDRRPAYEEDDDCDVTW